MAAEHSIFSLSLGRHLSLPEKLECAAEAGFKGFELYFDDFFNFAASYTPSAHSAFPPSSSIQRAEQELLAAAYIRDLCASLGLEIICFQPLRDFEGWRYRSAESLRKRREAQWVLSIARELGTDLLCLASNVQPRFSPSMAGPSRAEWERQAVEDLRWIADEASREEYRLDDGRGMRVAFESLAWGAYSYTTAQAWSLVSRADRPNLGLILDSFNALAREWADPTSRYSGGRLPNGPRSLQRLTDLISSLPAEKIFLLQLADANLPLPHLQKEFEDVNLTPSLLLRWSRTSRLFPLESERGAYLPVVEFTKAVHKTGFRGMWSVEVFNEILDDESAWGRPLATRGFESLRKLEKAVEEAQWKGDMVRATL
ncbi:hypothetical protein JAAARDRAFT_63705 [Jaapia argillacea MUCL 33604]|uniref:Xylose isomerase-like TIM barrel domain-containing protein n=1 Tax=Jaapia argillacea MUCL 33604 TaxID=933084 RepID=A0A067P6U2_9AGAM|nr:hypothetical protein JAAARDRAFT_63705 [Jaapia argillacea MUCL 33604]